MSATNGVPRARNLDCPRPEKWGYPNRQAARKMLKRERQRMGEPTLSAYRCRCGLFHIGRRRTDIHRDGTPIEEVAA